MSPRPEPPPAPAVAAPTVGWRPWAVAAAMLVAQYSLAVLSLVGENPTVDEVVHLPAGVTYWQTGTFKLYPHNPPLAKLVAALPVVLAGPDTKAIYGGEYWDPPPNKAGYEQPPNKAGVAHQFQEANAIRYLELFARARLVMPAFAALGGIVVFAWSSKLFGPRGGLLSLALWCLCPNILAQARLVTSDVAATSLGFAATFAFWRYLARPGFLRATVAGLLLGLAQLSKFSALLLFALWPILWAASVPPNWSRATWRRGIAQAIGHAAWIVGLVVLLINLCYGFEGVGRPLGSFRFASDILTRPRPRGPVFQNPRPDAGQMLDRVREHRENRFKGTWLGALPVPLPAYYLIGFDEQKLEADGVRTRYVIEPPERGDRMGPEGDEIVGYPVFLDGELGRASRWDYYLVALAYKVPEGTLALVALSVVARIATRRARRPFADEAAVLLPPLAILGLMSFGTNITIGLRYVLPIFPFVFVAVGRLVPWADGLKRPAIVWIPIGLGLAATAAATATIHPHYLAYFNLASGGPVRGSDHLIDSNLDWGQDLVGLREWARAHPEEGPIGLAYFGQVNPRIFERRGDGFAWFLPPPLPGTMPRRPATHYLGGPGATLTPGVYAVSASLLRGLPYTVYDPAPFDATRWAPYKAGERAFSYFEGLDPFDHIGHSILLYRLDARDVRGIVARWPELGRPPDPPR